MRTQITPADGELDQEQRKALENAIDLVSGSPLLQGKVVILTGAAGGIGRVIAQVLAAAGARLGLIDLDEGSVHEVLRGLNGEAARYLARALDASDPAAFASVVEEAGRDLGPVDGLVNCAGLWQIRDWEDISESDWQLAVTANLTTAFSACQAVLGTMVARGSGSIINLASTAGEYGSIRPASHYAAAKGGVIALTKSLAREVSPRGVRVNAVSPGPIDTSALLVRTAEEREAIGARTLLGRPGWPHEIAAACVFLLSDLSTFITGHVLRVNGGALV